MSTLDDILDLAKRAKKNPDISQVIPLADSVIRQASIIKIAQRMFGLERDKNGNFDADRYCRAKIALIKAIKEFSV